MLKPEMLDHLPVTITPFDLYEPYYPTGSAEILRDMPDFIPDDYDWVVNGGAGSERMEQMLLADDWTHAPHQHEYPDDRSIIFEKYMYDSYYARQVKVNIILCTDEAFYNKWVIATKLAKRLKLTDKSDRKILFQVVCEDESPNIDGEPNDQT